MQEVLVGALVGQCISSNKSVWLKWKRNPRSFMWGNEVGSGAGVFEVVQQCVCWGWLAGSQRQRVSVGEARPSRQRGSLYLTGDARAAPPFPLWSSGQPNRSQVTSEPRWAAQSCAGFGLREHFVLLRPHFTSIRSHLHLHLWSGIWRNTVILDVYLVPGENCTKSFFVSSQHIENHWKEKKNHWTRSFWNKKY